MSSRPGPPPGWLQHPARRKHEAPPGHTHRAGQARLVLAGKVVYVCDQLVRVNHPFLRHTRVCMIPLTVRARGHAIGSRAISAGAHRLVTAIANSAHYECGGPCRVPTHNHTVPALPRAHGRHGGCGPAVPRAPPWRAAAATPSQHSSSALCTCWAATQLQSACTLTLYLHCRIG